MNLRRAVTAAVGLVSLLFPVLAIAHSERPSTFPSGAGEVPTYRTTGPALVVCKPDSAALIDALPEPAKTRNLELLSQCGFENIQDAVNAVTQQSSRILVLPGLYLEEPYAAKPTGDCSSVPANGPLSYETHFRCPTAQNIITILGDSPSDEDSVCDRVVCKLQIEGTGDDPGDVIVDGKFSKLNVIRADRADGIYLVNFTAEHSHFNAVYIMETDGFAIDRMVGRNNDEYGFLTFSSDHGIYKDCEAYHNGDSGIYPGSASDVGRFRPRQGGDTSIAWEPSVEITRCNSHHNLIGVSGTAGNAMYVHDNDFHHNSAGVTLDSFFPNHPGLPQDSGTFVNNRIYSNNEDYYVNYRVENPPCERKPHERDVDAGVVCPSVGIPVGTGVLIAGGNANWFQNNYIWDNWRYGTMQFGVPAGFRDEYDPTKQLDTSHDNEYTGNFMGLSPAGVAPRNGTDFWWEEGGAGNCWSDNVAAAGRAITSDPLILPGCDSPVRSVQRVPNPVKMATLVPCALWERDNYDPIGCDWMRTPAKPS